MLSIKPKRNRDIDIKFCDAIATDPMAIDADDIETRYSTCRRRLWKSTCVRAALNVSILLRPHSPILTFTLILTPFSLSGPPSHSLNGPSSLAPSPQTSGVRKAPCRTCADHLWSQIGIVCQEKETMVLTRLGVFWEANGGWWVWWWEREGSGRRWGGGRGHCWRHLRVGS